jgi:hypothetical protein
MWESRRLTTPWASTASKYAKHKNPPRGEPAPSDTLLFGQPWYTETNDRIICELEGSFLSLTEGTITVFASRDPGTRKTGRRTRGRLLLKREALPRVQVDILPPHRRTDGPTGRISVVRKEVFSGGVTVPTLVCRFHKHTRGGRTHFISRANVSLQGSSNFPPPASHHSTAINKHHSPH